MTLRYINDSFLFFKNQYEWLVRCDPNEKLLFVFDLFITINNPIHAKTNISFSIPDIRKMNLVSLLLTLGLTGARWLIGLFLYLFDLNAASF